MSTTINTNSGPFTLMESTGRDQYPEQFNHRAMQMATAMGEFHNILMTALNSAYMNADSVKPGTREAANLLLYSLIICEIIEVHHDWEETSYFPAVEELAGKPGLLGANVDQHRAFEDALHDFHAYVKNTKKEAYSATQFREKMDAFALPLSKHLHEEPATFHRLRDLDNDALTKVYLAQAKIALSKGDVWRNLPMIFGNMDRTGKNMDGLQESIHPLPWFLPYLITYVFSWKYAGVWSFLPCDFWGIPKKEAGLKR